MRFQLKIVPFILWLVVLPCTKVAWAKTTAEQADQFVEESGEVTLRLLAKPDRGLPVEFRPKDQAVRGRIQQQHEFSYVLRNLSPKSLRVRGEIVIEPASVANMLELINCPCDQVLDVQPLESRELVVKYKVVPEKNLTTDIWVLRYKLREVR